MKRNLIKVVVWIFLSTLAITESFAGSDTATQMVELSIQEVALFDIKKDLTMILVPPTQAGQNFTQVSQNTRFAITSNVEEGRTRILNVRMDQNLIGMDLKVIVFPAIGNYVGEISLSTADQAVLTGIGNGVVNFSGFGIISYTLKPNPSANATLPYGDTIVNVTYTLMDDA